LNDDAFYKTSVTAGFLPLGHYRVVVLEQDLRWTTHDFSSLDEANSFASEAVSETGDEQAIAKVYDALHVLVGEGKQYWVRP
jgi:hypothetical protein